MGKEQLALLSEEEATVSAVKQFTDMYNEVDEKDLDMTKLELVLRNTFYAGMYYQQAINESDPGYKDGLDDLKEKATDFILDLDIEEHDVDKFFEQIADATEELHNDFLSEKKQRKYERENK
ncbi:MAG: hypothetical protein ACRC77_11300 [Bacteroidales bacterium]